MAAKEQEVSDRVSTHDQTSSIQWGSPFRTGTAFDFRSEIVTTPSTGMLNAIIHTTLHDDVYREDSTTSRFEREMSAMCGHEAGAFVITGTMANQLAIMTLLSQPPYAVLVDAGAHIVNYEAGGPSHMTGAMVQPVQPENQMYLTLNDIRRHAIISDNVQKCPTRVISLEQTTSGGLIIPLEELRRIYSWSHSRGILVHIDGARLWEAVAAGAGSMQDFGKCCDVVSVEFGKNLGAPMGAMVMGSTERIERLRRLRKSIGGGMRQAGLLTAAARQAVIENFGQEVWDTKGILLACQQLSKRIGAMWVGLGGQLIREVQTNMVWVDLERADVSLEEWNEIGLRHGVRLDGKRVVVHHQICDEAVVRLRRVFEEVLNKRSHQHEHAKL